MFVPPQSKIAMSDVPLHATRTGQRFYERTLPELVRQIERLNELLERWSKSTGTLLELAFDRAERLRLDADRVGREIPHVEWAEQSGVKAPDIAVSRERKELADATTDACNADERPCALGLRLRRPQVVRR